LDTPLFNSHRALWTYGPLSRRIIFGLKHGRQRYLADLVAPWLVPLALQHPVDCIIPVPLNADRLARRGFNQAALLATALGQCTGIPVWLNGLIRPLKTPSQGGFSAVQRRENVMGVFSSPNMWHGQKILLVDDVFTTGATLNACAYALRESRAHHVHAITLAKIPGG
jgi:ComF family protein